MTTSVTLPIGPFEHVSMDYARLREEGMALLGRLAGGTASGTQWTDFNPHDPGITILEQLCYAITDLGYRTDFPMPSLLAGGDDWLPGPEAILPSDAVTPADVRRLAVDATGVGNAWIEDGADTTVPLVYHAASEEIRFAADALAPDLVPVRLRGLSRVVVQVTEQTTLEAALEAVSARLHAQRILGNDFEVVGASPFPMHLEARIEVEAGDDPAMLMAEILESIDTYLMPVARFVSRADAGYDGRRLEEIFDGPVLERGFVTALPDRRQTVYASDLLRVMVDVAGVKAVRSLRLSVSGETEASFALDVPSGAVPTLASKSEIVLLRNGLAVHVDGAQVDARRRHVRARKKRAAVTGASTPAPARVRDLKQHRTLRFQLPAAYGVGPLGLPSSSSESSGSTASAQRVAQARQLGAYLLIFDQLIANAFSQLAHARDLLSPATDDARTYFADPVEDPEAAPLRFEDPDAHRTWLNATVEPDDPQPRRHRFLTHLLARFAEELGDYAQLGSDARSTDDAGLIEARSAFLRDYARLSRGRGSGLDGYREDEAILAMGGFEARLRHKLGLPSSVGLYVVEHVWLRPLLEDQRQAAREGEPQIPLLTGVREPDPWSLRVTVVIEDPGTFEAYFERFVAQTIAEELPAHLSADLCWLGDAHGGHWCAFESAWSDLKFALRAYRRAGIAGPPTDVHLRTRDARDRVIELLGWGRAFPLRDLPLPEQVHVAPATPAQIRIGWSQRDVTYTLCEGATGRPVEGGTSAVGTGGEVVLHTPPVDIDTSFRILAAKGEGPDQREVYLTTVVRVVKKIDRALVAQIDLPPLNVSSDNPAPSEARIGDFGVQAEVEVHESQEGVVYELVEHSAALSDIGPHRVVSVAPVVGTLGTIRLRTVPMSEDVDLRVRAQKMASDSGLETAILDTVLGLRVRANSILEARVEDPVIDAGGGAVLRLSSTQRSAVYQVLMSRVRDRDFVFDDDSTLATIDVDTDARTVRIRPPDLAEPWTAPPGYTTAGTPSPGTDGPLAFALEAPIVEDGIVVVEAVKQHAVGATGVDGGEMIASTVPLASAQAVLVRPDPSVPLRLVVTMVDGVTDGTVAVFGGEPGVFYSFRLDGSSESVGRPAYFHQADDDDPSLDKGVGQLVVEIDAVVARDASPGRPRPPTDGWPVIDTGPLPAGAVLRVQARRAMTGLIADLDRPAVLDPMPGVEARPAVVAVGRATAIAVVESRVDERYQLHRDGRPVGDPVVGTGATLDLSTGRLTAAARFTVAAVRLGGAIEVERRVDVEVAVETETDAAPADDVTDGGA